MNISALADLYRVDHRKRFRLANSDPGDTWKIKSKDHAHELLQKGAEELSDLQGRLYAENRWALLLIFQAMDAAGKDSTIKHVLSGVNPQGCQVFSFKVPSAEELDHDFLWRANRALPERGRIGIFNRSYYEEVLVVRVHPEFLDNEKLPPSLVTANIWQERFEDIRAYERYLTRNGTVIRKFFLHVSREEQKQRFLSRLEEQSKNWKFSLLDVQERKHWREYMEAYEDMLRHTSTKEAPWYVVPADHKWFTRLVVERVIIQTLQDLRSQYPVVPEEQRRELAQARKALLRERA